MDSQKRKVKIKYTITLDEDVPLDWDNSMIEFQRNESSWCASNLLDKLNKYDEDHGCICNIVKAEVIE